MTLSLFKKSKESFEKNRFMTNMANQNLLEKFEALQKENEELRKKLQDKEPFIHKNPYECLSQQDDHMEQDNEDSRPTNEPERTPQKQERRKIFSIHLQNKKYA